MKSLSCPSPAIVESLCVESAAHVFVKFEGVLEMHRFHPVDTVEYLT